MKILFLTHDFPYPPDEGIKMLSYNLIKELQRKEHQLSLLSLIENEKEKKYQTEINKKIFELDLQNKTKILGHFPQSEIPVIYAGAALFVFPSLYEGFGLPPLEAMACGCPVVASDKGSLPEVVGDAGIYVDPYNPENIAQGVIKVLSDENLRRKFVEKGFEQVKKFSWEKAAKETLKVFEEVVRYPEPSG